MKKLIIPFLILAILAMLLPAAALAGEVDKYYGYAAIEVSKSGAPTMFFLYFNEDQTCYYLAQQFHDGEPGLGRSYVGTWGYTAEGKVFAKIGENTKITLGFSDDNLVDLENYVVYYHVSALMD